MTSFSLIIVGNMKDEERSKKLIKECSLYKKAADYDPDFVEILSSYKKRAAPGVAEQLAEELGCGIRFYRPDTKRCTDKLKAFTLMQQRMCDHAMQLPYGGAAIVVWNGLDAKVLSFVTVAERYGLDVVLLRS